MPFALQGSRSCARSLGRLLGALFLPLLKIARGLLAGLFRSLLGRRQVHSSAPRLRETDGDCLFGRSRAVLSFTNMLDLFADKLSGLRAWRFSFFLIFFRSFQSFFFRH